MAPTSPVAKAEPLSMLPQPAVMETSSADRAVSSSWALGGRLLGGQQGRNCWLAVCTGEKATEVQELRQRVGKGASL